MGDAVGETGRFRKAPSLVGCGKNPQFTAYLLRYTLYRRLKYRNLAVAFVVRFIIIPINVSSLPTKLPTKRSMADLFRDPPAQPNGA